MSPPIKKQYLRVLIEHIIFDGKRVEVKARNDGIIAVLDNLEALEAGDVTKVMFEAKNWQPIVYGVYNPIHIFEFLDKALIDNILRFNPIQIGEWLEDLLTRKAGGNKTELSRYIGMSRTRVVQFLALAGLPAGIRAKLRQNLGLNEYQIRRMMAAGTN